MPIYTYKCPSCETKADLLQKMDSEAPKCQTCPDNPVMVKQVATGIRPKFVGSGFYENDYKNKTT